MDSTKDGLMNWIQEQRLIVSEWRSRPSRLRPEAAQHDMKNIHSMKEGVNEKMNVLEEMEMKQMTVAPDAATAGMEELKAAMKKLDNEVKNNILNLCNSYIFVLSLCFYFAKFIVIFANRSN